MKTVQISAWLSVFLLAGCSGCGSTYPGPAPKPASEQPVGFTAEPLDEVSGLATSLQYADTLWTHNDSGDDPRIFAVDGRGALKGIWRVDGAQHEDWEDITTDDSGHLWIGDIGNNDNERRDLTLYRVAEPDPSAGGGVAKVDRLVRISYPDQHEFPPKKKNRRFDAEALFWAPSAELGHPTLFILTKHRNDDLETVLYRVDDLTDGAQVVLTRVSQFRVGLDPLNERGGRVTGAAATPDGRLLAVLSYHAIFIFERPATGDDYVHNLKVRIDLDQPYTEQAEAITWQGQRLLFGNEQRRLFTIEAPITDPPARFGANQARAGAR